MKLLFCINLLFIGAVLFAIPNMTRREILFAVPVPTDFRNSPAGRRAIFLFRAIVGAAVILGVAALLLSPLRWYGATAVIAPLLTILTSGLAFYWQNRRLAPLAVQYRRPREAALSSAPEHLPPFTWFAGGPFFVLAAAALWLAQHWDRIPARFPVHFDALGQPDRWADRTTKGVFGMLLFGAELCAWFLIMALAGWFGSRRSPFRSVMLGGIIAVEWSLALFFALGALQAPLGIPGWVPVVTLLASMVLTVIVIVNKASDPRDAMDPTPNDCWKAGIFYYNPNDAALFVEKRDGFGYTFNFANRTSWALLLALALVIASVPFVAA